MATTKRRPPARTPAPVIQGAKVTFADASHNPPTSWQQWLRAGVLCRAKDNMFASSRNVKNRILLFSSPHKDPSEAVVKKGELVMCLGEVSRVKVPDINTPRRLIVRVEFEFLFSAGVFVASPECFEESDGDDTV